MVAVYGYQTVVFGFFLFEYYFYMVVRVCPQDKFSDVEQQFVQAYVLHLYLFLLIVGLGKIKKSVNQFGHASCIVKCV